MTVYPDLEDTLSQVKYLGFHVRELGLLQGCLARPQTTLFGEEAYPSLEAKGAALVHAIATSRPLIDGNKRTAWAMLVTFLAMNSQQVVASADEGLAFMVGIAGNTMEVAEITEWISAHLEPLN